ncbi:E3 ubiquitin-protein ligase CCNB1IP1-like isoform X2 [Corticium candelabrum]|nr:E3 ubiquitin-protein ligase CCNB1IP1-like isoform X2 [Corticium candelabrum]
MVLAGQRPDVVMEICSRAMAFWTYQSHQERMYQEYVSTRAKEKCTQLEQYYQQVVSRAQTEMAALKQQITNVKKDLDSNKLRYNEVSDKLMERNRQYQRLQAMYDSLRRRSITPRTFNGREATSGGQGAAAVNRYDIPLGVQEDDQEQQHSTSAKSLFDISLNQSCMEDSFSLRSVAARQMPSESQADFAGACQTTPARKVSGRNSPDDRRPFSLELNTPAGIAQRAVPPRRM